MRRPPKAAIAVVLASAVLLALGTGLVLAARPQATGPAGQAVAAFGSDPALDSPASVPSPSSSAAEVPEPTASPMPTAPTVPPSLPAVSLPRSIRIPDLGITARVRAVGLDAARAVEVPDDISEVGWYEYSAAPGSAAGASVIVGHRDGRVDGHGAFYGIASLHEGDRITITRDDGSTVAYRVTALRALQKSVFAEHAEQIFALDGPPRLRLISCGGYYDADRGGYQSNVIVTAVPVGTDPSNIADQSP